MVLIGKGTIIIIIIIALFLLVAYIQHGESLKTEPIQSVTDTGKYLYDKGKRVYDVIKEDEVDINGS